MKKKTKSLKPGKSPWNTLRKLIREYAEACVVDSWKGGGDPVDYTGIELRLELQTALLNAHIEKLEREFDS